jgi:hypothetical protein
VPKVFYYDGKAPRDRVYITSRPPRRYGVFRFLVDVTMCMLTGGLWLVWIFVREMRNR